MRVALHLLTVRRLTHVKPKLVEDLDLHIRPLFPTGLAHALPDVVTEGSGERNESLNGGAILLATHTADIGQSSLPFVPLSLPHGALYCKARGDSKTDYERSRYSEFEGCGASACLLHRET